MRSFFKSFFAALLALIVFAGLMIFVAFIAILAVSTGKEVKTGEKAVLVVDLSQHFAEVEPSDPLSGLTGSGKNTPTSLSKLIRLIEHAGNNSSVKGIYIRAASNNNDLASSEELRDAIVDFKSTGKFVYAYGDVISQRAYYVANAANKIYCNPAGGIEWHGLSLQMPFIKGALEKLEVEPQIFYAGKFKSATEPLREKEMTEANKIQSREILADIYNRFLLNTSASRKIDTASLRKYADNNAVQFASSALQLKMVDGLKYDDEVKDEIRKELKISKDAKINFIYPGKYAEAVNYMPSGDDRIAVIYAEGNIYDGKGDRGQIGGDTYMQHIRKARTDNSVKAIVIRINSGGGSALASEIIWREIMLAKKEKPVIVSLGDYAASGGYYVACAGDSIFAQENTITGSIGVFSVIPNMQKFFNNKLGVTFDGVATGENANPLTVTKPLTPLQKQYLQSQVDTIYQVFKSRVSDGRNKPVTYIDSIAQGRVWSGSKAVEIGLVDKIGGLNDAIAAAAAKAKIKNYRLKELPGKQSIREMIFGEEPEVVKEETIKKELGEQFYKIYSFARDIKQLTGKAQARMPFEMIIE